MEGKKKWKEENDEKRNAEREVTSYSFNIKIPPNFSQTVAYPVSILIFLAAVIVHNL